MPTVVIASDDFQELAENAAQALGLPEARIFTVPHPIGGVAEGILRERAESGAGKIMALFAPDEHPGEVDG